MINEQKSNLGLPVRFKARAFSVYASQFDSAAYPLACRTGTSVGVLR